MSTIDAIPSKPPVRRVCADFHGEAAVEVDMLEVQIGINRAARNKSERDAVLMELALLSLRKHISAFSALTGDKYPDYQSIAKWLERADQQENGKLDSLLVDIQQTAEIAQMHANQELISELPVDSK